jgi:hypothetical protein
MYCFCFFKLFFYFSYSRLPIGTPDYNNMHYICIPTGDPGTQVPRYAYPGMHEEVVGAAVVVSMHMLIAFPQRIGPPHSPVCVLSRHSKRGWGVSGYSNMHTETNTKQKMFCLDMHRYEKRNLQCPYTRSATLVRKLAFHPDCRVLVLVLVLLPCTGTAALSTVSPYTS